MGYGVTSVTAESVMHFGSCPHILVVKNKKMTFAAMVAYFIHTVPSCLVVSHISTLMALYL